MLPFLALSAVNPVAVHQICERQSALGRESKTRGTNAKSMSRSLLERTCASSDGGPDRKSDEQSGGRSILGTVAAD